MRLALLTIGLLQCETRGTSNSISMTKECYSAAPGSEVVVHAQVRDGSSEGTSNVKVRWQVVPRDGVVSLSDQLTTSAEGDLDGLRVDGLVSARVQIGAMSRIGSVYTVIVQTVDDSALSGDSRITVADRNVDGCTSVDAGVGDAAPPDGAPVDATPGNAISPDM